MSDYEYIIIVVVMLVLVLIFRKPSYNKDEHKFIDASGRLINGSIDIAIDGRLSSHAIKDGVIIDGTDFRKASQLTIYNKKGEVLYCMDYLCPS